MNTRFDFSGKTCVVTGGASGMGREIVNVLAAANAEVFVADLNCIQADKIAAYWAKTGHKVFSLPMDGTNLDSVVTAAKNVIATAGKIDFLVNSMGIGAKAKDGESFADTFNRLLNVDLNAIFNSCHAFGEAMIEGGGGVIINIASQAATIVPAKTRPGRGGEYGLLGYCTAKAGVRHLTRSIATLWAPYGIRANSVSPGYVDTPLTAEPHSDPVIRAGMISSIPLGRIAAPNDIAGIVAFLLSDEASYLTAQDIIADGGYTAQ